LPGIEGSVLLDDPAAKQSDSLPGAQIGAAVAHGTAFSGDGFVIFHRNIFHRAKTSAKSTFRTGVADLCLHEII